MGILDPKRIEAALRAKAADDFRRAEAADRFRPAENRSDPSSYSSRAMRIFVDDAGNYSPEAEARFRFSGMDENDVYTLFRIYPAVFTTGHHSALTAAIAERSHEIKNGIKADRYPVMAPSFNALGIIGDKQDELQHGPVRTLQAGEIPTEVVREIERKYCMTP